MRVYVPLGVLVWALCLTPFVSFAQSVPATMVPVLVIESPPELAPVRARLERYNLEPLAGIVRLVGLSDPGSPMRVVLAEPSSEWASRAPSWAAGYAVGDLSLIVLFPSRAPTYPHDTLEDVLRHEVAHILIARASGGRPVPTWFHEGFAVAVERPWGLGDRTRLASELLFGPRLTLSELNGLFAGDSGSASRGYSVSAAVMRDMMQTHGAEAPAGVLRALARGASFDEAVRVVTGRAVYQFESAFWDRQRTWTRWIPLAASSTVLWLGVIGLAALARRRRRQRAEVIRQQWAREEQAEKEAQADQNETIH